MRERRIRPDELLLVQSTDRPTLWVLGTLGTTFLAFVLTGQQAYASWTGLSWRTLAAGQAWRPLTSLFWYGPASRVELFQVFGAFGAWLLFGTLLDEWWGTWRTVLLAATTGVVGNLAAMAVSTVTCSDMTVGGPGAAALGLLTAGLWVYRGRFLVVPRLSRRSGLPTNTLALGMAIVLGLSGLVELFRGACMARYAGYLAAVGTALMFLTDRWRIWRYRRPAASKPAGEVIPFPHRNEPRLWN